MAVLNVCNMLSAKSLEVSETEKVSLARSSPSACKISRKSLELIRCWIYDLLAKTIHTVCE
jgi:hypothetical protein